MRSVVFRPADTTEHVMCIECAQLMRTSAVIRSSLFGAMRTMWHHAHTLRVRFEPETRASDVSLRARLRRP